MARNLSSGPGRVLTAVYAVFALAATGRSAYQLIADPGRAPLAYTLSAFAAVVYIVATVCLVTGRRTLAIVAVAIEFAGVFTIGAISYAATDLFPDKTVWSHFGQGYGYLPALLPILGLWWLLLGSRRSSAGADAPASR